MRKVEVQLGVPEWLEDSEDCKAAEVQDFYTISFCSRDIEEECMSVHATCLCYLAAATEAWLTGKSIDEVRAIMENHNHE